MSEPNWTIHWTLARTARELQLQQPVQEQLQLQQGLIKKTSTWLDRCLYFRSRIVFTYLRVGFINFSVSMILGSVISISLYIVLLISLGDGVRAVADDRFNLNWLYQYRWANHGSSVRLTEGWDGVPSTQSLDSELVVSFDNDLGGPSSISANSSVIFLHRPRSYAEALKSCRLLNETLWDPSMHMSTPLDHHLSYLATLSKRPEAKKDLFWISHALAGSRVTSRRGDILYHPHHHSLPAICTNSAPHSYVNFSDTSAKYQVIVDSNYERYVGYRDKRSFRFIGMRYAAKMQRWEYSVPNVGHKAKKGDSKLVNATLFGDMCAQKAGGSEDCLTLNVFTSFLPIQMTSKKLRGGTVKLKAVMVWIHGGSLLSGSSRDPTFDGGNFASRGDVVVVTMNYRLGTLGFMALRDDHTFGNFGLRDIATALEWIKRHIHDFGGDKNHITLVGQSAGAAAVRALLASDRTDAQFDKAIMMSTPGGLGHMDYFSKYLSSNEVFNRTSKLWERGKGFNCKMRTIEKGDNTQLACLRRMPLEKILGLDPPANKFVMDGHFLQSTELRYARHRSGKKRRHQPKILLGWMRDDAASIIPYPKADMHLDSYLNNISLPNALHSAPKLFYPSKLLGNSSLEDFTAASRIATNLNFRCAAQSTAFNAEKGGKYGNFFNDKGIYVYEFDHSYQLPDYPSDARNELCRPRENRNKAKERYFKCHSGELYYVFGNMAFLGIDDADGHDYDFSRMIVDTWASFIRTGNPNLNADWLRSRGYYSTLDHAKKTKMWRPIGDKDAEKGTDATHVTTNGNYPGESVRILDWPSRNSGWRDLEQCHALHVGLGFYRARDKGAPTYGLMGQRIDGHESGGDREDLHVAHDG